MKLTLTITLAVCALCTFAAPKTDPLDAQLKQVYRNMYHEVKEPPNRYYPKGQHIVQRNIYRVTLDQKLSDSSGIFRLTCESYIATGTEHNSRESFHPDIIIINLDEISDMAKGDSLELGATQTLWGLGTVTLYSQRQRKKVTLRQFSFRRRDALAYIRSKRQRKTQETCPTCGQPMPQNF